MSSAGGRRPHLEPDDEEQHMRTVVAYELVSLDGVAQDPDTFITTWDDVLDANLADVIATQDAVVLGRRSHDDWAEYWPTSDVEPFATFINGVAKHVATSTPLTTPWTHSTVVEGDLAEHVRALKAQPGGDIGVHASISVVQALLAAGVLDELRLVVAPHVAGSGKRLLDGVPATALELTSSTTSPTGHLVLTYRCT
jgi:dihydrofolate reductase